MKKLNGGTAFPVPGLSNDESFNGMTLRDYFAAHALQGVMLANFSAPDLWAADAYKIADAMILERAK